MTSFLHHARRATTSRRGSAYVLVVMVTFIVVIIGLSAVALSRIEHRREQRAQDDLAARSAALSGLEVAYLTIRNAATWNAVRAGSGTWASNVAMDGSVYTVERVSIDETDPLTPRITVQATGTRGQSRCILRAVIVRGTYVEPGSITKVVTR